MSYTATTTALRRRSDAGEWRGRLRLVVQSTQTPRIVVGLLAIALAVNVAREAATLARLRHVPADAESMSHAAGALPRGVSTAAIVGAHLFGAAARPTAGDRGSPAEEKALVLTGTVAGDDPATGYAFIGPTRDQTHFYAAGTRTAEGALLLGVYEDHVIINRGGRRLTLSLPRRVDLHLLATPDARVAGASAPLHEPTPDEMTATLQGESDRMAELLTEKPLFVGDKLTGVQIEAGSSAALLQQLGLQPGDILMTVDGTLVTPERLDWLRTHLASGDPVKLAGTRPGQGQFNVTVNSRAVAGMIAP